MLHVEKSQGLNRIKHYDWIMAILTAALCSFGLIVIASVSKQLNSPGLLLKQGIGVALGTVAMVILSLLDYKDFRMLGYVAYAFSTLLLVLVLFIGEGYEETGTRGWLVLGPVSYQPSELGKITFVLIVALYLERIVTKTGKYNYIKLIFFAALPIALVLLQPDIGTSLVYVFIFMCMIFLPEYRTNTFCRAGAELFLCLYFTLVYTAPP